MRKKSSLVRGYQDLILCYQGPSRLSDVIEGGLLSVRFRPARNLFIRGVEAFLQKESSNRSAWPSVVPADSTGLDVGGGR
jgi:hypothetical protein